MNRLVRPINFGFEPDIVNVFAMAQFGASGAVTLNTNNSKGICNWSVSSQVWKGTTHSNTSVTGMESLFGVFNGMTVTGSGIPASTTVSAVNPTAGTLTLSQSASTSLTGTPLTFTGGQYVVTFGSQYTPYKRLDNYVKLLQLTYNWDMARISKLLTASTPQVPAAPFVFLLSNQSALANQTIQGTGTTATSTAVSALSNAGSIVPGMLVSGSGVAAGTYVESVNVASATLVLSAATSTSVANDVLTYTPINPSSIIIQCGIFSSSTLTMNSYTPAGTNSAPALTMNSYTPAGTNNGASPPIFSGTPATLTGTVAAPVFTGTPATLTGTVSAPSFLATNPASQEILRLGLILSRSNAI